MRIQFSNPTTEDLKNGLTLSRCCLKDVDIIGVGIFRERDILECLRIVENLPRLQNL